ncbi:MAG: menaquinone biosynthesis decarboxylase [Planctomycetota bacterium]
MAYKDLGAFVRRLEEEGELRRVPVEVDPELELCEITDRVSKAVGPALLFEKVRGSSIPVLINALGSRRRVELALEVDDLEDVARRLETILDQKTPESFLDKLKKLPMLLDLGKMLPKVVKDGPCKEVVWRGDDVDLGRLPILRTWPGDAGRFITMPLVFTRNPRTGHPNCGMYRLQVMGREVTGFHSHRHHDGAHNTSTSDQRRVPVAAAIGCDPATVMSAILPAPPDLDEMILSGFLRQKPVPMVRCELHDLRVPAESEIVLEGWVDLDDVRTEGPFGDHTGWYSLADRFPTFKVECITMRREPLYMTTIVGQPPQEDCWIGQAIERIFLPIMKKQFPEIVDVHMPFEGVFHNLMLVSIDKRYPGHARKIMNAIWSLGQAMFTKIVCVFDKDVDVQDPRQALFHLCANIDPERDMQFTMGPAELLDHASRASCYGSKVGIDATRKWAAEGFDREWPDLIVMDEATRALVDRRWDSYGLGPFLPSPSR